MKRSLRARILKMLRGIELLQFSQFTIDWVEDLELEEANDDMDVPIEVQNHALKYHIEITGEVLREGKDKQLFRMLSLYANLQLNPERT